MAISKNPNLSGFRGTIDKTIVVRQDPWGRTILSAYPDMSNITPSTEQLKHRLSFKEAQVIALKMLSDPLVKAFYKSRCEGRQRPHNILISELLKKEILIEEQKVDKRGVVTRPNPRKGK